jgi:hypothetical protein
MVKIDDVYQKVLAIANKEQRGYITPQEFNLFADQAQMDIFEQYFYDINQFGRLHGNDTEYSDMLNILEEKISIFKKTSALSYNATNNFHALPANLYRLGTVFYDFASEIIEMDRVQDNELIYILKSAVKPTSLMPVYVENHDGSGAKITTYPNNSDTRNKTSINYIRKPAKPNWTYVVVNEQALYNSSASDHQDFELHVSEENNLINKILQLAGISMGNELYQVASQEEVKDVQQEKI